MTNSPRQRPGQAANAELGRVAAELPETMPAALFQGVD